MTMTSGTPRSRRRGLYGLLAGGLLSASAAMLIALPVANAQCDQTVGNSIDSYLKQHPDLHQQLQNQSRAEGGNGNVMDYLNRHPDVRQHLIDLSQQCAP
jgi:gas vesicle protein